MYIYWAFWLDGKLLAYCFRVARAISIRIEEIPPVIEPCFFHHVHQRAVRRDFEIIDYFVCASHHSMPSTSPAKPELELIVTVIFTVVHLDRLRW